ncbi:probable isoprenylcysteine alpha-carbonyl methylesterase ICMEL2 isoform X2 [Phragmites australis]|uniref:probable isoprenylcysteine alpha-carbonyl methylesterase ICMEL2 isoform X1 n=1 Tax=Phragmites australis TaxID=29695 RepID=UPI002D78C83D|nr:probable isoprenylcysteine alpha-carbonyl methylesterase ICMEL2 isoform X1 [Phragmites australis]XP_062216526.1 probable isoprenylcysteine alpha-carbonyl methylesterase ICMEL2 isoform X2 [Phragmites australis]
MGVSSFLNSTGAPKDKGCRGLEAPPTFAPHMLCSPRAPHASLVVTHSRSPAPASTSSFLGPTTSRPRRLPAPPSRTPPTRARPKANSNLPTARRHFAFAMRASVDEAGALLARSDSAGRRRHPASPVQSASPRPGGGLRRQSSSFRDDVGHAASETYLVSRLAFTLLRYLGIGYRWMSQLLALTIYAILLMPGFIQVGYYYFFSSQVHRSIVYGDQPRNRLDLYIPKDNSRPYPVVAFVTGGAWIIGYKAWGALLGRRLAERGIIVACIDYRNFPQGTIGDMVNDASQGISFVCNNIASYGGDPNQIYLMGQSAGAHIAACALMEQAVKESSGHPVSWSVTQIKAYFGLSGGYNIHNLVDHFNERGLHRSIFLSIMEGEESLSRYSPEIVAKKSSAETITLLPLIVLMHGTEDYSIPSSSSQTFVDVLQQAGAQARLLLYEGKTHTDIFLQDPLRGGRDPLVEDLLSVIHADDTIARQKISLAPTPRRLVFEWQLKLARRISPF